MNVAEVTAVGETVSDLSSGMHIYSHQSHRSAFVAPRSAVLAVLPPDLAPHKAAPAYLYRLGWSALRRGGFRSGMSVAVVGLGALGLATVELAVILGGRVAAVSRRQAARAAALDRGAELADEPGGPVIPAAWPERAELVVTTSNRWTDWRAALTLAAFNARVAVLGFPGRDQPSTEINPLDSALFYDKQLSLIAAGQGLEPGEPRERDAERLREDMARILAWIADGTLAPDRLVWAARPWHELAAIYGELEADAPPGVVLLDWS
jgi:threonine dehydrogenase-like Zn-dependent dehydrogenase